MSPKRPSSVLIVDDNTNNLHVLASILRSADIKVATAKDGYKALKFIRKKKPDLILLDIMMPEMDGYEVCEKLKRNDETKNIPVIFISALNQTEDKLKGFETGGVDYITKPFRREEVFARVNVHLTLERAREELKSAKEKLEISNATKDKLFSIIAHDLRGPISSLAGMLEIVESQPDFLDGENKPAFFRELRSSAQGVFHLLENLLHWAGSQRNAIEHQPEIVDLNKLAENNITLFSSAAAEKGVSLSSDMQGAVMAYADVNMVMTVMRNLISNALKFTPEAGEVRLGAKNKDGLVEVTVSDNGVGIPEFHQKKLFQIQEHFTTYGVRNEKGSGLGLLLCKEFVEKNGGEIRVESQRNHGSRFIFTLPPAPGENNAPD